VILKNRIIHLRESGISLGSIEEGLVGYDVGGGLRAFFFVD